MKKVNIAGAAIASAHITGSLSFAQGLSGAKASMPSVHLTQQDFVSTFPWGIRGDKVRIDQQEVENEILDAETLAAMAFMLGFQSCSKQLDEAWKLLLNSHNHDVHVCLYDETGIEWCDQARGIAAEVRQKASEFIASLTGGSAVALNTLSWTRPVKEGISEVPAFGYAVADSGNAFEEAQEDRNTPWKGWFKTEEYSLRLREDGCLETRIGSDDKRTALLGHLTLYAGGKTFDCRSVKPEKMEAWLSSDRKKAFARIEGRINDIAFVHRFAASGEYIDIETTFDYGSGCYFGPEIEDFEKEPRRTHYFQHERKLCMNWRLPDTETKLLHNSPFLTWSAVKSRSIESLHYLALQAPKYGMAHFNIGQSGYGHIEEDSACRHVLAFAPKKYVYGKAEKLPLSGKQTHRYRFVPYMGDWRKAKLPLCADEFQRPMVTLQPGRERSALPQKAGLVRLDSNTTIATALFERGGRLFIRLWEWAGQEDSIGLKFGDEKSSLTECTHALKQIGNMNASFEMRPWEIKTIELVGKAKLLEEFGLCSTVKSLKAVPEGWQRRNLFTTEPPRKGSASMIAEDAIIYFSSGYHDGFVKPLEKQTPTMEIEMQRIRSPKYPNYTSTWEIGGSCWVSINEHAPEYLESLKPYLKEGSIEIVGGTWSEPFNLLISGESNMRQFMYGLEAAKEHLDMEIDIYMNQEHGTFAQMPQILRSFGLKAVVNRTQWAPYGYESGLDAEVAEWIGVDGSTILLIPRYNSMDYLTAYAAKNLQNGSITGHNRFWRTKERFVQMRDEAIARGVNKPLMTMLEDIWSVTWRSSDEEMDFYASLPFVKFTSIARYLAMFGL
ncbi:MAG: hypothetical protein JSW66_02835 [Phycisphaerales bacterium]|nr:MAG: hypothetical protein JSW66_02835 [Phycisphaerales bacterium]